MLLMLSAVQNWFMGYLARQIYSDNSKYSKLSTYSPSIWNDFTLFLWNLQLFQYSWCSSKLCNFCQVWGCHFKEECHHTNFIGLTRKRSSAKGRNSIKNYLIVTLNTMRSDTILQNMSKVWIKSFTGNALFTLNHHQYSAVFLQEIWF